MENGGNAKVNAIFEANLAASGAIKPTNHADGPTRERFIRDKYERRKFYDARGFADYAQQQTRMHDDIVLPALETSAAAGQPSEAARKRVEERKERLRKCTSNIDPGVTVPTFGQFEPDQRPPRRTHSAGTGRRKPPKAPSSAPVPTMDLLDCGFESS